MSKLYLIATPIGNLEDITLRALTILGQVDAMACEDTRYTRIIFEKHKISSPRTIFSYHEHNEERAGERILGLLESGSTVAICTDGGYPLISDPGYKIVCKAIERGFDIEVIPGATAVQTALVYSGLPTSSYTFKGFPPRKEGARRRFLEMEKDLPHSMIFFESPFRVAKLLASAYEVLGDRKAAVCVEMTKKFESIHRGLLSELLESFKDKKVKGEITVVIAGNKNKLVKEEEDDELEEVQEKKLSKYAAKKKFEEEFEDDALEEDEDDEE